MNNPPKQFRHQSSFVIAAIFFIGCFVIEVLGIEISNEARGQYYNIQGGLSYVIYLLLNTLYGRKYGLNWIKSLVFSCANLLFLFVLTARIGTRVDILIWGHGSVAAFRSAMFLPFLCLILSRFCKVNMLNLCDFLTPYFFFLHGFVTNSCWIAGCCAGKPMAWGLQNPLNGMTVFPLQPCVILASVAVAWWGLRYAQKHDYQANGMVFANSLILYGIFRYLVEFFSDDPRIFGVLSWLSVCSLFMIAMGFLVRYIVTKHTQTP